MLGIFITFQGQTWGVGRKLKKQFPQQSLIEYAHLQGGGKRGGTQVGGARGRSRVGGTVGASQGACPLLLMRWSTYVSGSRYKGAHC